MYDDLFVDLFAIAPNGILPTLKLEKGIKDSGIFVGSGQNKDSMASDLGNVIRMMASHYRTLAGCPVTKRAMFRKAVHVAERECSFERERDRLKKHMHCCKRERERERELYAALQCVSCDCFVSLPPPQHLLHIDPVLAPFPPPARP